VPFYFGNRVASPYRQIPQFPARYETLPIVPCDTRATRCSSTVPMAASLFNFQSSGRFLFAPPDADVARWRASRPGAGAHIERRSCRRACLALVRPKGRSPPRRPIGGTIKGSVSKALQPFILSTGRGADFSRDGSCSQDRSIALNWCRTNRGFSFVTNGLRLTERYIRKINILEKLLIV
jgi:hypothetical protein